jgi:hypothetical protein
MLTWFPILILCGVVDRNPGPTDEIRIRLNNLLGKVIEALMDENLQKTNFQSGRRTNYDFSWCQVLRGHQVTGHSGFFSRFAGQSIVKFHYGVANSILIGIEEAYVAQKGRNWLGSTVEEAVAAKRALMLGFDHDGELWGLDYLPKEIWEPICAILMVVAPVVGAFVISYFTPTVGLGCRSGGYLIFFFLAFAQSVIETIAWWTLSEGDVVSNHGYVTDVGLSRFRRLIGRFKWVKEHNPRCIAEWGVLFPMEVINTGWLFYIITAQTIGSYNNCICQVSNWAGGGG